MACRGLRFTRGRPRAFLMLSLSRLRFVLLPAPLSRSMPSLILPRALVMCFRHPSPGHDVKGRAPGSSWLAATNGSTGGANPCRRTFHSSSGWGVGSAFLPAPLPSRRGMGFGAAPHKPPCSNTGVTFPALFHVEHLGVASCEELVL